LTGVAVPSKTIGRFSVLVILAASLVCDGLWEGMLTSSNGKDN
jgi:hypothetical protein